MSNQPPATPHSYADERRALLEEFVRLPHEGDVVKWQRSLAEAIMRAEKDSNRTGQSKDLRRNAKDHRHLLRVIGDALVHTLIPSHTIRTLSRHPGRPAYLSSQGEDFEFVLETAQRAASLGAIPIVADLTTLIGVGDLLILSAGGGLTVVECKNRPEPLSLSGRVERQRRRGEDAAFYLAQSRIEEDGGIRVAIPIVDLPDPDYELVERLLRECIDSPEGVAAHTFAERDLLVASRDDASMDAIEVVLGSATPDIADGVGEPDSMLGVALLDELVQSASHRRPAPSSYPLPADLRWRLLERDLHLLRLVDVRALAAHVEVDGVEVRLEPRYGPDGVEVAIEGSPSGTSVFTRELAELCLWTPISAAALREVLIDQARQSLVQNAALETDDIASVAAEGDEIAYGTFWNPLKNPQAEADAGHDRAP